MKFLLESSRSRSVHNEEHDHVEEYYKKPMNGVRKTLTVWRKSLLMSCNGFTVIDSSNGRFAFRVDNYMTRPENIILMDSFGKPILTVCRPKKLRLVDNWLVYEGEIGDKYLSKKPIWCLRKHINILQPNVDVLAHVYRTPSDKRCMFVIEGSYANRSCKVLDESRMVVAEIKRKEAMNEGVSFGLEVFVLIVWPGFDPGFAMAIVLLLDQMFS